MKKIHFLAASGPDLASYRLRMAIPAAKLSSWGLQATVGPEIPEGIDTLVLAKHFDKERYLSLAENAKGAGSPEIIFDVCDDHFTGPHAEYYAQMVALANKVVCNSDNMRHRIKYATGVDSVVVSDPFEGEEGAPSFSSTPNILWFGNRANLSSIMRCAHLFDNLTVLTNQQITHTIPGVRFRLWSERGQQEELARAHVVVIPRVDTPAARCKSPNRLVEAIRAGKYVITNFPEVYDTAALAAYSTVTHVKDDASLAEAVENYKRASPDFIKEKIRQGQKHIEELFSPQTIASQWAEVLTRASSVEGKV